MSGVVRELWALGPIPFHLGPQPTPSNAPFPDLLPFSVGVRDDLGLLVQVPSAEVAGLLEAVYRGDHRLGVPMQPQGLGREYCDDFLAFIRQSIPGGLAGRRVLEIGSGSGYLLSRLHAEGARATGVEPSAARSEHVAEGVEVLACSFEECRFDGPFDAIVHFAVLEHAGDPVDCCRRQLELLGPHGRLIFAVPDCSEPIARGDLSMFIHEHGSYFTPASLGRVAAAAGAEVCATAGGGVGATLYSCWQRVGDGAAPLPDAPPLDETAQFAARGRRSLEAMTALVRRVRGSGRSLGIFCPGRFLNYRAALEGNCEAVRFFDDNPALWDRYFPPLAIPIESREGLLASPPDVLLILSRPFGPAIAQSLRSQLGSTAMEVILIDEVC